MGKKIKPALSPIAAMEEWEDDVLRRYPEPESTFKAKKDFRNGDTPIPQLR